MSQATSWTAARPSVWAWRAAQLWSADHGWSKNVSWSTKQTQLQSHILSFLCNGKGGSAPSCFLCPVKMFV